MADLLGDLTSGDSFRVWRASWDVIRSRDTAELDTLRDALPQIRRATQGVDLGGMIRPNRDALEHALARVAEFRSWSCWCDDYPRLLQYDPNKELEFGHVDIVDRADAELPVTYEAVCSVCGRRFTVEEGEHHALWWRWRPLSPKASARLTSPS
jgi:hypothetical protein